MKQAKKCATRGCRNKTTTLKICWKCKSRNFRKNNPMRASYLSLKSNAKRRGKVFTISFEYFQRFAYETDYLKKKGRTIKCWSIDRIKNELGYIEGNIRCIPVSENSKKGTKVMNYDYQTGIVRIDRYPPGETAFLF